MASDLTVALVCDDCGEALDFDLENGFASHDEYHECFGEKVRSLALVDEDGVRPTKEGISVEVLEA